MITQLRNLIVSIRSIILQCDHAIVNMWLLYITDIKKYDLTERVKKRCNNAKRIMLIVVLGLKLAILLIILNGMQYGFAIVGKPWRFTFNKAIIDLFKNHIITMYKNLNKFQFNYIRLKLHCITYPTTLVYAYIQWPAIHNVFTLLRRNCICLHIICACALVITVH